MSEQWVLLVLLVSTIRFKIHTALLLLLQGSYFIVVKNFQISSFKTKKTRNTKNRENDLTKVLRNNEPRRFGRQKLDTEGEM